LPIGRSLSLYGFVLKIFGRSPNFWPTSLHGKNVQINVDKNGLGYTLADFSQTHLVALLAVLFLF
jgi:hypothetical protein